MIAAIYARKSTDQAHVDEEAKSCPRQIENAAAFIASKGWSLGRSGEIRKQRQP